MSRGQRDAAERAETQKEPEGGLPGPRQGCKVHKRTKGEASRTGRRHSGLRKDT
jgi:hypothetical protein